MRIGTFGTPAGTACRASIRRTALAGSAALLVAVGAWGATPAFAQATRSVTVDIRAQELGRALTAFADQAGLRLLLPSGLVSGRTSPALAGTMTRGEALSRLLAGTGLAYGFTSANTVTIIDRVSSAHDGIDAAGALVLDTIDVTGGSRFTTGFSGDDVYSMPGAVSAVSGETINERNAGDIDGILRSSAGTFTLDSPAGTGLAVNIRGMEGLGRVALSVDGVRQSSQILTHYQPGNLLHVAPGFVAGVEVQRGTAAGTSGFGALNGSFNVRTIDITDVVKPGRNWGGFVSTTYGDNSYRLARTFAGGVRFNDQFSIMGAFTAHDQGEYWAGRNDKGIRSLVNSSDSDITSGMMKIEYAPDSTHAFRVSGILHEALATLRLNNRVKFTNNAFSMRYAYTPGNDIFDTRLHVYSNFGGNKYLSGSNAGWQIDNQSFGFEATNRSLVRLGDALVYIDLGAALFSDNVTNYKSTGRIYFGDGKRLTGGAFMDASVDLGVFDLKGGLRYDIFSLDGLGGPSAVNGPISSAPKIDTFEGALNPSIQLSAQLLPWLQPYVSYAHSYRAPTVGETLMSEIHGSYIGLLNNPDLKGERSRGWEVGANVSADGVLLSGDSLRMKMNYFNKTITNYIWASPMMRYENVPGTTPTHGVEIEASYDAGHAYIGGSYTNAKTEMPPSIWQNSMPFANSMALPEEYFTIDVGVRLFEQKLQIGGRAKYVSETFRPSVLSSERTKIDSYTLFDLYASYRFNNNASAFLNIENVADTFYIPAVNASVLSRREGRGRTVSGGLKVTF